MTGAAHRKHRRISVIVLLPPFFQESHTDALPAHDGVIDHLSIARLEDVQGEIGLWKQHHIGKREHWNGSRNGKRLGLVVTIRPVMFALAISLHGSR